MEAAVYHRYGPPNVVAMAEVPKPIAKQNEVLIEGRNVDTTGRPIEISTSIWPASRIRVHV